MLNLPSNKLCKLKSKWCDSWVLVYPTLIKKTESDFFGPLMTIRYEFCLASSPFDSKIKVDDTLFLIDNEDWILDKPTVEDMLMLDKALKETNRYVYNLKTKKLIDKNPPLELPF